MERRLVPNAQECIVVDSNDGKNNYSHEDERKDEVLVGLYGRVSVLHLIKANINRTVLAPFLGHT